MIKFCAWLMVLSVGGFAIPAPKYGGPGLEDKAINFFERGLSSGVDGRLVGGTEAAQGSYPWMVAITSGSILRIYLCGGALITNRHIITAAHCHEAIMDGHLISTRLIVGTNNWTTGGTAYSIRIIARSPDYNPNTRKNDISVIGTTAEVIMSQNVRSISISYEFVPGGIPVRVSGWGWLSATGSMSDKLHELRLNTFDGDSCGPELIRIAQSLGMHLPRVNPMIEICTLVAANFGTCFGDGGSPLVNNNNNQLIGIASWGLPCARGAPDVFTRISAFRDFIHNMINFPLV